MRKNKPKTRQNLFIYILTKWRDNEIQCAMEWCIRNRNEVVKEINKEYEEYLKLWDELT